MLHLHIDTITSSIFNKQILCFKVKEQCDFRSPLEDKIRVMVGSSALKAPISTRLIPSVQMTSNEVLGEITKVLQSNEKIPLDKTFTKILHACNGGEKMIADKELGKTYYVDGFCEETGVVLEYLGCLYHACQFRYDLTNDHLFYSERKMEDVYKETITRV